MTVNHIAIIPDGNRRWAKEKGLPTFEGHRRGFDVALDLAKKIRQMGVSILTLWAFSTENWKRTTEEVSYLMGLYEILVDKCLKEAIEDKVRVIHLGRKDRLPKTLLAKIEDAENRTKIFDKYFLNIALDYGGRDEVERAIKKIPIINGQLSTEGDISKFLDTGDQPFPEPEIIIRTSGELRTSGFMIWQSIYSEWFFMDKYFPDLNEEDIKKTIEEYNSRKRRFGK
jgi:undecaprenyl diphosphate synthase